MGSAIPMGVKPLCVQIFSELWSAKGNGASSLSCFQDLKISLFLFLENAYLYGLKKRC